jgi:hypothetical protein
VICLKFKYVVLPHIYRNTDGSSPYTTYLTDLFGRVNVIKSGLACTSTAPAILKKFNQSSECVGIIVYDGVPGISWVRITDYTMP